MLHKDLYVIKQKSSVLKSIPLAMKHSLGMRLVT